MKTFLFLLLLFTSIWADFFIVHDDKRIKMAELSTGKIDFSTLSALPIVDPKAELSVIAVNEDVNHKHLNFRTATIALLQSNTSLDEYSTEDQNNHEVTIEFGKSNFEEDMLLQLFYHNRWYAVALGDPLDTLHHLFADETLDPEKAYMAVIQAQKAYPDDRRLTLFHDKWETRHLYAQQVKKMETIRELGRFYASEPTRLVEEQLRSEITAFETTYPKSDFNQELEMIKRSFDSTPGR